MKVLLLTGLGALFFAYYWDDNFDPGGRELPEAGRPQGLLHRGGHGLP
ncbi:HSD11B1L isoform 4 [Pan troglodytes]|uniref:Hydroxysteroid 11-beta dehydrogenase 1 like n=3 Tax=Hominidae TaxID=9604 RepID=J3QKX1_HUMAN|nr:HSD11B1L isoform 4 [Pan troglodytes]PNJ18351.1 HSD11B1L isoform 4 [Pongo abelii]